jgi:CHAT domain-containing protein
MLSERQNAYLKLIRALLECPSGMEPEILNANRELIDAGLVDTMVEAADILEEGRQKNRAKFLRNMAARLAGIVEKYSVTETSQENLFLQVLQLISRDGDTQEVYQLLAANLDKLDDSFAQVLRKSVRDRLSAADPREAGLIAIFMGLALGKFSILIQNFSQGEKACNIEIAIAGYESALLIYKKEKLPEEWAAIQTNLGSAYGDRIRGERAENIERGIACCQEALQVFNPTDFPEQYAMTQNNLGAAYSDRIYGNKADNMKRAMACYQDVLQNDPSPEQWQMTQVNLAASYIESIRSQLLEELEPALSFLLEGLNETRLAEDSIKRVYLFLETNLNKLDENLLQLLQSWRELDMKPPSYIARNLSDFSKEILAFPLGNRDLNLEIAIAGYETAARGLSANPIQPSQVKELGGIWTFVFNYTYWPELQKNLGEAYQNRRQGKRSENLQKAIACCQEALKFYRIENSPLEWANTNFNLGATYFSFHQGNRTENVKKAIACFENSLQVFTLQNQPKEWAIARSTLAVARTIFSHCSANTMEQEIEETKNIIHNLSPESFPEEWANSQLILGNSYRFRIPGDRAENLEKAIEFYQNALQVFTREAFPREWAAVQYSLGMVFRNRIIGNPEDNIEQAIGYFQDALQVENCENFPEEWATTQHGLAKAYRERRRGNPLENIEKAFQCFNNALLVRTPRDFPQPWAATQHQLGALIFFKYFCFENKVEDLINAISSYENALKVFNPEDCPDDWARTQCCLSEAFTALYLQRGRTENWQKAVASAENHLQVFTRESSPRDHVEGLSALNKAYLAARRFRNAYDTLKRAIDTVELLRGEIVSGDTVKQKLAERWNELYQHMVEVCLERAKKEPDYKVKAIEYVERSKARNLVELLATRDLYPKGNIGEDVLKELNRLRREIAAEDRRANIQESNQTDGNDIPSPTVLMSNRTRLNQLRQELDALIAREIQPVDPNFSLTQTVKSIPFSQMQELLPDDKTAIIEWYVTGETFITFIITRQSPGLTVWQPPPKERQALIKWSEQYLEDYRQNKSEWQTKLPVSLNKLAEILHLDEILENWVPVECDRLILIPHRHLHLFPLHALPVGESVVRAYRARLENSGHTICTKTPCLLDIFPRGVSYAPSCQLLQLAQNQKRPDFSHFFGVQNPTKDLTFTDIEVAIIQQRFQPNDTVLGENDATKENLISTRQLLTAHCTHFSCHGIFNFESPFKSALILAGALVSNPAQTAGADRYIRSRDGETIDLEKCLTLAEIFSLDLRQCRLVTLSACETGMTDFTSISDEYIGLPSGFLYAGSLSVVSSQWKVNDLSTAFLIIRFYHNVCVEKLSVALALNQAQIWLRDVTKEKLEEWTNQLPLDTTEKKYLRRFLNKIEAGSQPFQQPYHWAAFCAVGQ